MSVLGAISNYYSTGSSTALTKLKTDLADTTNNKVWADALLVDSSMPYVVLSETGTSQVTRTVTINGKFSRVLDITVAFDVYAKTRLATETILDDLETVYLDTQLTIANGDGHNATLFSNRMMYILDIDKVQAWYGMLELTFRITKTGS